MKGRRLFLLTSLAAVVCAACALSLRVPITHPSLFLLYLRPTIYELQPQQAEALPIPPPFPVLDIKPVYYSDAYHAPGILIAQTSPSLNTTEVELLVDWLIHTGAVHGRGVITFLQAKDRQVAETETLITVSDTALRTSLSDAFPFQAGFGADILVFTYSKADGTVRLSAIAE